MPASMASADEDGKVALPVPQSWGGVHASNYMDITFELVDGDFKVILSCIVITISGGGRGVKNNNVKRGRTTRQSDIALPPQQLNTSELLIC